MNLIRVCHIKYEETSTRGSFESYEFIDEEGNVLLREACRDAFVCPLVKNEPVKRPLQVGDLAQMYFEKSGDDSMRGIRYHVLDIKELPAAEFKEIQKQAEREHQAYSRTEAEVRARYTKKKEELEEQIRILREQESHELPHRPDSLETRLVQKAYGSGGREGVPHLG